MYSHAPIMTAEILGGLRLEPGMTAIDCTAGGGGHLKLLALAVGESGKVLALDQDKRAHQEDAALGVAAEYPQVRLIQARFSQLQQVMSQENFSPANALLADIGVSSAQLDQFERGFSFKKDGPLDMRMNAQEGQTAFELIQESSEEDLANLIYEYGEERYSRRIAKLIKSQKDLENSTFYLAGLISRAYGGKHTKTHPATRTFQALRIAVNRELEELDALLRLLPEVLKPGGRVAIMTFHSLEDRRVKNIFRENKEIWKIITKKPIRPSQIECNKNKRARSAKLRIAERIIK